MEPAMQVKSVGDLCDAYWKAQELLRGTWVPWFRGHSEATGWRLVPTVFRGYDPRDETEMTKQFVTEAPCRISSPPLEDDYAAWLGVMRHHGLPTRLLDWTESIAIAAFFAVCYESQPSKDGPAVIWALNPFVLNKTQYDLSGIPLFRSSFGKAVATPAFDPSSEQSGVLAVKPAHVDTRMMLQQSVFTVHGSSTALEEMQGCESFLARFDVPFESRSSVADGLRCFGITRSKLFPDLDALAYQVRENIKKSRIWP